MKVHALTVKMMECGHCFALYKHNYVPTVSSVFVLYTWCCHTVLIAASRGISKRVYFCRDATCCCMVNSWQACQKSAAKRGRKWGGDPVNNTHICKHRIPLSSLSPTPPHTRPFHPCTYVHTVYISTLYALSIKGRIEEIGCKFTYYQNLMLTK